MDSIRQHPFRLTPSPVSFGAFKIGRNEGAKYESSYELPSEDQCAELLSGLIELGINLFDTAPAYGISEERLGRHLHLHRDAILLSTKVGETFTAGRSTFDFSAAGITRSVERSLKRLRTDYLDLLLLHSDGRDLDILNNSDAVTTLQTLKKQGLALNIGLSGKTVEGARAALDWADALMVEYHPSDTTHDAVMHEARVKGLAVLIKKPLGSGRLSPAEAIPFILRHPAVTTLVIGGLNLAHMRQNLALATAERA